ncbi:EAL domain-containing protein [Clostridium sp. CS001]|uniref:sensor domain-containing protein n=1 Tax=Clostridium sp. CS001 TaxID=2880648 RepID=UPI001CF4CB0B|nr:GGDEF domain-containing phosphodiesterase [Clostridium sp. CS001]MCB2289400.1 EAL domain-containing protein [Clostridium sp. CS001]
MIYKLGLGTISILLILSLLENYILMKKVDANRNALILINKELIEKEEMKMLAIDGSKDVVWEWNLENNNLVVSKKWEDITGYSINENINFIKNLIHEDDLIDVCNSFKDYMDGKSICYQCEFRIKIKNDSYKWVFIRAKGLRNIESKFIKLSGSITDISDIKAIEKEIKHKVYYDTLTNLPNKVLVTDIIEKVMKDFKVNKKEGAIIFLDLDDFKKINDTLGHHYGDQLLKIIAEILKISFDENDTVARFGGDEFLIVMNDIKSNEDVILKCNKIIDIFKKTFEVGEKNIYTSASMGITIFPRDSDDINRLLINADAAMYKAKGTGKNKYCFYDEKIKNELVRKNEIEKYLRQSIKENELEIYYQPKIHSHKKTIMGVEALLRWNSKKIGSISPYEFIPIAEEAGLIKNIGEWVIKGVCNQIKLWESNCKILMKVSINVSPVQLQDERFVEKVKQIVFLNDVDPQLIEFEITETSLMNNIDKGMYLLNELKDSGFSISLDDFGTGYSSLKYLKALPIDNLKIDKSFIDNITVNKKDEEMARGIIQLAHNMDLIVIVEGVETKEQYDLIKNMNADIIQGYYFSRPVTSKDIEEMILDVNKRT